MKKLSVFLLLYCFTFLSAQAQQQASRPNILVILSDDHAYQSIGAYGSTLMPTPNIDRIAREGALFTNANVTNSLCAPSRATLLTGKYSHENGLKVNNISNPFNVNQQIFTRLLKQQQYATAWIGKWHLQTLPGNAFDYWKVLPDQGQYYNPAFIGMQNDTVRTEGYITDIITKFSLDWLNKRDTSKPFCLVIGEKATHRSWLPDLQDLGAYDDKTFLLPDNFYDTYEGRLAAKDQDMTVAKTMVNSFDLKVDVNYNEPGMYGRMTPAQKAVFKAYYDKISKDFDDHHYEGRALAEWKYQRYMKDYLATARSLDRNIGVILDYLDKSGLAQNTIVVYASDQGFYLGEHGWFDKRFMYEESLRTPLVMRYPKAIKPGTVIKSPVVNIDFAPTFLSLAGVPVPADMQGQSILPLFKPGKQTAWRKGVYYHYYEFPEPHHVSPHFGIKTDRYKLIRFYGLADFWELYDLQKDPKEMHNLYNDAAYKKIIDSLKQELNTLINQYKDDEAKEVLKKG